MCGDVGTSKPERDKSVLGEASMSRLSGFRDNETGDARAKFLCPMEPFEGGGEEKKKIQNFEN